MVQLDTRLPMMIQQPNVLAALDAGTQAAGNQNALMRQAEGQNLFRQHGAGAMRGDQGSMNALAGFDPMMGQRMQSNQLGMQATRQNMSINAEKMQIIRDQTVQSFATAQDQAEALRQAQETDRLGRMAVAAAARGDAEGFANATTQLFDGPLELNDDSVAALASVYEGAQTYLKNRPQQGGAPLTLIGKINEDVRAGRISPAEAKMELARAAPRGTVIETDGAGGFRFSEGAGVVGGQGFSNPVTPGQRKVDEAFATSYLEWTQGGGADLSSQIARIDQVADQLAAGAPLTGPMVGNLPDAIGTVIAPEAVQAREQVEEVVQRNLRLILGAQFTENEGNRLIARAYNPRLLPKHNAERLSRLSTAMRAAADARNGQVRYFEQNGTLTGWSGKEWSIGDFITAIENDASPAGPASASPSAPQAAAAPQGQSVAAPEGLSAQDAELWPYFTEEERAAIMREYQQ